MPLYINDPEVDRLINELTTRLRLGKTEAVRRALKTMEKEVKAADRRKRFLGGTFPVFA